MLTLRESQTLLEILQTSGTTLEAAAIAFQRAFVRAEHFRVAAALCVLIEDGLLPRPQRPVALFIIHDLLLQLKHAVPQMSFADLWTLAGCKAVEFMGGPRRSASEDGDLAHYCPAVPPQELIRPCVVLPPS